MKMNVKTFNKIRKDVEKIYNRNDFTHNMIHINEAVRIAGLLSKKERADAWICKTAALLHDIAKNRKNHGIRGAEFAEKILRKNKLDENFIDKVCYCIANHSNTNILKLKEANIMYDSDKLQAIGPNGFVRILSDYIVNHKTSMERAVMLARKEETTYMKNIKTKTAKKIAWKQHACMANFYNTMEDLIK